MADEQIIVEIKVSDDELKQAAKNVDNLTGSIEEMTNLIGSARKQNKAFKKEQQELNKAYKAGAINTDQYEKAVDDINKKIKTNNKLIAETSIELSTQKRERNANIKLIKTEANSLKQLEAKASILNQEISKTNKLTKEGAKRYKELSDELGKTNAEINQSRKGFKDFTRNIGNYTESINESRLGTGELIDQLSDMPGATGAAAGGVQDLQKQLLSLLKNPVALLIAAIVAGLTLLFNAFKKSAGGSRSFAKGLAVLDGLFGSIIKLVEPLGEFMSKAFDDPKKALKELGNLLLNNIINRFKGILEVGKAVLKGLKAIATLDFDELAEAAADAGQAIIQITTGFDKEQQDAISQTLSDTADEAKRLGEAMVILNEQQFQARQSSRGLEKSIAVLNAELELLEQITGDDTLSMRTMAEAALDAAKVAADLAEKESKLAQKKLNVINAELMLRRNFGQEVQDLLDQQVAAEITLIDAKSKSFIKQKQLATELRKIERDEFEQNLDVFLDIGAKIQSERDADLEDETKALSERKKLLKASKIAQAANNESILKEFESFAVSRVQLEKLLRSENAKTANEQLKSFGLNEIQINRLREVIINLKQSELDFAKQKRDLAKEETDRNKKAVTDLKQTEIDKTEFLAEQELTRANAETNTAAQRIEIQKKLVDALVNFEKEKTKVLLSDEKLLESERQAITQASELEILEIKAKSSDTQKENQAENIESIRENFAEIKDITAEFAGEEFAIFGELTDNIAQLFESEKITAIDALNAIGSGANAVFASVNAGRENQVRNLEKQKQAELEIAGDNTEAREAIEAKFDEQQKTLKLKQFNADKANALLSIGINTAVAVMKTFAQLGFPVGVIPAAIMAGLGIVQGAIVATKQPPAFGDGGQMVSIGDSHASGNDVTIYGETKSGKKQPFGRVEKGESMFVLNRRASQTLALSRLNQKYGGKSFGRPSPAAKFQDGGEIINNAENIDISAIVSAIAGLNIFVKVEDITTAQGKKIQVRNLAEV